MTHTALITVIIPCYNQGTFLEEALESVFEQTYPTWECIIVNDGSTDNTDQVADRWCKKDGRFHYVFQQNKGLSAAKNNGLTFANGAYIQFLDADDLLHKERFARLMEPGEKNDVLATNFKLLTSGNRQNTQADPPFELGMAHFRFEEILMHWEEKFVIPIHAALFKKEIFKTLRFDESLGAREDWLMWLQVYSLPVKTLFIDMPLAIYRMQPTGMSQNRWLMNKNLSLVYMRALALTPDRLKPRFFQQALEKLGSQLEQAEELLRATQQSRSYRLGNFFVRRIGHLRSYLQPK